MVRIGQCHRSESGRHRGDEGRSICDENRVIKLLGPHPTVQRPERVGIGHTDPRHDGDKAVPVIHAVESGRGRGWGADGMGRLLWQATRKSAMTETAASTVRIMDNADCTPSVEVTPSRDERTPIDSREQAALG
jgi:hypothetical protein